MPKRRGKGRKGRGRKGKGKKDGFRSGPDAGPANRSPLTPAIMRQVLRYPVSKILAASVPTSSVRFTPNGVYDIDPTLGSTAVPGFIEWASLYGFYRVVQVGYKVQAVSLESSKPCKFYAVMLNSDPGTTLSGIIIGNSLCKETVLGINSGMGRATLSGRAKVSQILGSKTSFTADSYRAVTTANPADLIWIGFGATTLDGGNFASGIALSIVLTVEVEFYDRLQNFGSYMEKITQTSSFLEKFESDRDTYKRAQKQQLCPCAVPREVDPAYRIAQAELFKKWHPLA